MRITGDAGAFEWPSEDIDAPPVPRETLEALRRFRGDTAVTTYTVIGNLLLDDYPVSFGPHGDEVRTLP